MHSIISTKISAMARREPSASLEAQVLETIRVHTRRRIRSRMLGFSLATLAGIGAIADIGSHLAQAFMRSGFYEYLKLPFSDGTALALWKELGMSLLESLPIVGVIGVFAVLAFIIWAGANAVSNARKIAIA